MTFRSALFAAALLVPTAAAAEDLAPGAAAPGAAAPPTEAPKLATKSDETSRYAMGARVGGYGFRRDSGGDFDECRMGGIGVFGERRFGDHLFLETGLDMYFSQDAPEGDLPINRVSGLVTAAAGVRTKIAWRLEGYAQLGVGLEMTKVSVPYEERTISDQLALPLGFFGFGGDIRVGGKTHLGAVFRAHMMGNFDYDPARLEMQPGWTEPPAADEVFDPALSFAAQAQFYVRRDL